MTESGAQQPATFEAFLSGTNQTRSTAKAPVWKRHQGRLFYRQRHPPKDKSAFSDRLALTQKKTGFMPAQLETGVEENQ